MRQCTAWGLAALVAMAALLASTGPAIAHPESRPASSSSRRISPAQLSAMLRSKDFLLVNVHVPYDGEIQATDAFVPFDQVQKRASVFPAEKQARIVLYCLTGRMSAIAAASLVRMGYRNVFDLDGGMVAWARAGYRVLRR